jgi:hypothetical protein
MSLVSQFGDKMEDFCEGIINSLDSIAEIDWDN